jgi:PIN domain nuclease of toxin-antitoxin system
MLLDTCAVLWFAFNREKFSPTTLHKLDLCTNLIISTMSFWEIGIKVRKKKLSMPLTVSELAHLYSTHKSVSLIAPDNGTTQIL